MAQLQVIILIKPNKQIAKAPVGIGWHLLIERIVPGFIRWIDAAEFWEIWKCV
jgi:hypothetical protein